MNKNIHTRIKNKKKTLCQVEMYRLCVSWFYMALKNFYAILKKHSNMRIFSLSNILKEFKLTHFLNM